MGPNKVHVTPKGSKCKRDGSVIMALRKVKYVTNKALRERNRGPNKVCDQFKISEPTPSPFFVGLIGLSD